MKSFIPLIAVTIAPRTISEWQKLHNMNFPGLWCGQRPDCHNQHGFGVHSLENRNEWVQRHLKLGSSATGIEIGACGMPVNVPYFFFRIQHYFFFRYYRPGTKCISKKKIVPRLIFF